jgi:hypothetical protein
MHLLLIVILFELYSVISEVASEVNITLNFSDLEVKMHLCALSDSPFTMISKSE